MDDFHEQTKFMDEPRKWHGMPWEAPELATLRELYKRGTPLREICDRMERPKEGVLAKLVQLGLIRRVADGCRYVYRRKVLPDSYKVSFQEPRTKTEKLKEYMEAYGGNPAKVSPTGQGRDTPIYPYIAAIIGSIDAGIFKDAASGITTCQDFSGLEMRAANATTTGRVTSPTPNHTLQTQPKELS